MGERPGCMAGNEGPDEKLVAARSQHTPQHRPSNRYPPEMIRSGQGCVSPSGQEAEQARPEVTRGIDGPGFQIARARPDAGDQQSDDQRAGIRLRGHGVIFACDGEDAEYQQTGQDYLIHEGVERGDELTRMGKEHTCGPAIGTGYGMQLVVVVNHRLVERIDQGRPDYAPQNLCRAVGRHLAPRKTAIQRQ